MKKLCPTCDKIIIGRTDKKYCSGKCRSAANHGTKEDMHSAYLKKRESALIWAKKHKLKNRELYMLKSAKERAKKKGIVFNITIEDIVIPFRCPLIGIKLKKELGRENNTPTLDKIIPELGYVKGNVWVISWKANRIKSDLNKEEIISFCKNLLSVIK